MSIQGVSSSSSSSSSRWKYDVFLSFRGMDTRKNFIDHLYATLVQKGIYVFRDDRELGRGKPISPELLQAIEESRISVIVFSRNYASSGWCLDEIVKIVECKNTKGQNVFPIFYDVDPSVVRNQTGVFQKAFFKHEEKFKKDNEKIQKWRNALRDIANLSGWNAENRHESEFIQDIVQEISTKLGPTTLMNFEDLVGIKSRLEELKLLIGNGSNDVRMIGIWGMGGIGKTTIARVFYDLVSNQFEESCFLANVREISEKNGLVTLQQQLLFEILRGQENNIFNEYDGMNKIKYRLQRKKVLLVIDDVVHREQLNKLAGKHDWFGLGSRIIIITRDKHLLLTHGVDKMYEAEKLNHNESLQLLILKAFKNHQPPEDYRKLSELVVRYAGGLPLALEVLGSSLFGRTIDEWNDTIERLKRDSNKEILDKLKISFDVLEEAEKKIFLDVACFFKEKDREYVTRILDGCGFNPTIGISVLLDKSLITSSKYNELSMHDLLQEMGRQIVKRESGGEPGQCSRLWDEEDIRHVLTKNTGTNLVEAIMLEKELYVSVGAKVFSKMINLRMLKIRKVQLPEGLEYLSTELRLLDWEGYPLKSLPSNLQLDKLVEFKMEWSPIKQLWKGNKPLNMLKSISFECCNNLIQTPDFTGIPNLENLNLTGCSRLRKIHPSLLVHKKIKFLMLSSCSSLTTLPSKMHMESLEDLKLSECSKLKKFPEITGSMECLRFLYLRGTAIKELSLPIEFLARLEHLDLHRCKNLLSLPSTISGLKSLQVLILSGCSDLKTFPEIMGSMKCLVQLFLQETAIKELPLSISRLAGLKYLNFEGCKNLLSLPSTINDLKSLQTLSISYCTKLASLPSTIGGLESLGNLSISYCPKLASLPSTIGGLESLKILRLSECTKLVNLPNSINSLKSLQNLDLTNCSELVSFPNGMKSLTKLCLSGCSKLENVPEILAQVESLKSLNIGRTVIRQPVPSIFMMKNLEGLYFCGCGGPSFKSFLEELSNPLASTLPSLSGNLCSFTHLDLSYCNLGEGAIPSDFLGSLISLRMLDLSGNNFVTLPTTINRLSKLGDLRLKYCTNLQKLSELPSGIYYLGLNGCVSLEKLSNAFRLGISQGWEPKEISCQNCFKLHNGRNEAFSMLKEHLLGMNGRYKNFSMAIPGSEFPEWFTHKSEGSSMKINTPPYLYNNRKLVGFIVCCVFIVRIADQYLIGMNKSSDAARIWLGDSNKGIFLNHEQVIETDYEAGCSSEDPSDHLWLHYFSRDRAMDSCEGRLSISIISTQKLEVKRCGLHPVYEHEDFNELIQDFDRSTLDVKSGIKILYLGVKRKVEQMRSSIGLKFRKTNLGFKHE